MSEVAQKEKPPLDKTEITRALNVGERIRELRESLPEIIGSEQRFVTEWTAPSKDLMAEDSRLKFGSLGKNLASLSSEQRQFRDGVLVPLVKKVSLQGLNEAKKMVIAPLKEEGRGSILEYGYNERGFTKVFDEWNDRWKESEARQREIDDTLGNLTTNIATSSLQAEWLLAGGDPESLIRIYNAFRESGGSESGKPYTQDQLLIAIGNGVRLNAARRVIYEVKNRVESIPKKSA